MRLIVRSARGKIVLVSFAALALSGCARSHGTSATADQPTVVRTGFTCCNLHYDGDWISDANVSSLPFIPAGTPIIIKSLSGLRAYADIAGRPMRLGLDYGYERETAEHWINKLVVLNDPRSQIASFSAPVRSAISAGQVMAGMTKDQVIIALGYPRSDLNPILNAPFWRYTWSSSVPYAVHWRDGKVHKIDSNHEAVSAITYTAY